MYSESGKKLRLGRVFNRDGRAFVVALDHGILMGAVKGIEDLEDTVKKLIKVNPDALQVTPGAFRILKDNFIGRGAPSLIIRLDVSNYLRGTEVKGSYYENLYSIKDAVSMGAEAVVVYYLVGYEDESIEGKNIREISKIISDSEEYGMPVIVEPLYISKGYDSLRDPEKVKLITRIASELGADALKVDYTGDKASFKEVVRSSFAPILVRGGPKSSNEEEFIKMMREAIECGAKGITVGRNLWQSRDIERMGLELLKVVHG
jgi:class I fructose-bisphosphate aldolase